jgi:hypothetical protein
MYAVFCVFILLLIGYTFKINFTANNLKNNNKDEFQKIVCATRICIDNICYVEETEPSYYKVIIKIPDYHKESKVMEVWIQNLNKSCSKFTEQ